MNRRVKIALIFSLGGATALVCGSRFESLLLLGLGGGLLVFSIARIRFAPSLYVAAGVLPLVFQLDNWGWLSGRDAHGEAIIVKNILEHGWPVPSTVYDAYGFQPTPGLHLFAAVMARLTGLSLVPTVEGTVLLTQLLPILLVLITLSLVVVAARQVTARPTVALIPLLCWPPLLYFYTAFRRPSMGLLLFVLVVTILFASKTSSSYRLSVVGGLGLLTLSITHHLTTVYAIVFLGLYAGATLFLSPFSEISTENPIVYAAGAFTSGGILYSFLLQFQEGRRFINKIVGLLPPNSDEENAPGSTPTDAPGSTPTDAPGSTPTDAPGSTPTDVPDLTPTDTSGSATSESLLSRFFENAFYHTQNFLLLWGYVGVLSTLLIYVGGSKIQRDGVISPPVLVTIAFSCAMSAVGLLGWLTGMLEFRRPITVWIVTCGWLGVVTALSESLIETDIRRVLFGFLFVSGLLMIPAHDIGISAPNYQAGETEQEFSPELYLTAEFLGTFSGHDGVVGDANVREVVTPLGQMPVRTGQETITSGNISSRTYVIIEYPRNDQIYFGSTPAGWTSFETRGLRTKFRDENVIYTTNKTVIYT